MISIIVPFYNEEENLEPLYQQIVAVLDRHYEFEIIFVDDGSTDSSRQKVSVKAEKDQRVKLVTHRKRLGKGAALSTGFKACRGDIIVFMDADLQDDPNDLPRLLQKIEEGYDVVNGWRKIRRDSVAIMTLSRLGNIIIWKRLLHSPLHDLNCGFKAISREVLNEIPLYGDNFRFIPLIAEQKGYKVGEVIVHHRPRLHGVSKYTVTKAFFGLFDTFTTYFIFKFSEKPLHFFGLIGGVFFAVGLITALYLSFERIFHGVLLYRRPALLWAILMIIVGLQIALTGIVAELLVYFNQKNQPVRKS